MGKINDDLKRQLENIGGYSIRNITYGNVHIIHFNMHNIMYKKLKKKIKNLFNVIYTSKQVKTMCLTVNVRGVDNITELIQQCLREQKILSSDVDNDFIYILKRVHKNKKTMNVVYGINIKKAIKLIMKFNALLHLSYLDGIEYVTEEILIYKDPKSDSITVYNKKKYNTES